MGLLRTNHCVEYGKKKKRSELYYHPIGLILLIVGMRGQVTVLSVTVTELHFKLQVTYKLLSLYI